MKLTSLRGGLPCAAIIAVVAIVPNYALAYCSEPSAPYCATRFGQFDDEWDFRRCKSEMESYQSYTEEFIQCNNTEAQDAARKARSVNEMAISTYNAAVQAFNRRANE